MHFSLKIRHLVATILMIFLRVLPKKKLSVSPLLGSPRSSGTRFIEPLEPRFHANAQLQVFNVSHVLIRPHTATRNRIGIMIELNERKFSEGGTRPPPGPGQKIATRMLMGDLLAVANFLV